MQKCLMEGHALYKDMGETWLLEDNLCKRTCLVGSHVL